MSAIQTLRECLANLQKLSRLLAVCGIVIGCMAFPATAQNLTTANAPDRPIIIPSSGNLNCIQGHYLHWMDQDYCGKYNLHVIESNDRSGLVFPIVGGQVTAGQTLVLNFQFNGQNNQLTVVTDSNDTPITIAGKFVAAIKATPALFNSPNGGEPGPIFYVINSWDGGSTPNNVISVNWDTAKTLKLFWWASGGITFSYDSACWTSQCPKLWDVNPMIQLNRFVMGTPPPANSIIGAFGIASSNSATPNNISTYYGQASVQVQSSTMGQILSRWQFTVPDFNGNQTRGTWIGYEGVYPMNSDAWSGHVNSRWQYVWAQVGDFSSHVTVQGQQGWSGCRNGVQVTGGIVTGIC